MKIMTWTIFGAGGLIHDINEAIELIGQRIDVLVLDMELDRHFLEKIPSSIKIIKLEDFQPSTDHYLFGFIDPNKKPLLESLNKFNLHYSNLIHKFSYVSKTVKMAQGNYISAGVVLATNVRLGSFNYINRSVSVGHDTELLNFNHLGPGSTVAGNCKIGNNNFLGAGSVMINKLKMKDEITIGAGGVVVKDILDPGTYVGVPVRYLK